MLSQRGKISSLLTYFHLQFRISHKITKFLFFEKSKLFFGYSFRFKASFIVEYANKMILIINFYLATNSNCYKNKTIIFSFHHKN